LQKHLAAIKHFSKKHSWEETPIVSFLRHFSYRLFPPETVVGFSHKNEWRNVSLAKLINGQKWWVFGNILLLVYLGFLHSFQF
jgi:hypothetical protein